jgi:hypothetical protein
MLSSLLVLTVVVSVGAALAVAWRVRSRRLRSRVLFAVAGSLATAAVLWALIGGLFVVALFEPWPLALRQGPDTAFSRACYAELLGDAPVDVTEIYCRMEWGFGGDSIASIRFVFQSPSTVDAIVRRRQLEAVPAAEHADARYLGGPKWWPPKDRLLSVRDVYQRSRHEFLWVDVETMEAYYQHAGF